MEQLHVRGGTPLAQCMVLAGEPGKLWVVRVAFSQKHSPGWGRRKLESHLSLKDITSVHFGLRGAGLSQMETAEVTITDLHPATVELLLQYCYGCLHTMPSHHAEVPPSSPEFCPLLSKVCTNLLLTCRLACTTHQYGLAHSNPPNQTHRSLEVNGNEGSDCVARR